MLFDLENETTPSENYKLMSQTVIPRPIAWVVTENNGVINIAPFSYFIPLSSNPASVLISVGHRADGTPKDTLANLRKHQKCTICMVNESSLEKMHFSSKGVDKEISEAQLFDIKTDKIFEDYPPVIEGVPCAYFCDFNQEIDLGGANATIPLVLNIKHIYVNDDNITDKDRLSIAFDPVARIGRSYAFLGDEVETPIIP